MPQLSRLPEFRQKFCAILLMVAIAGVVGCFLGGEETRWTMVNVCGKDTQADCHLLELSDGSFILIDPADAADAPGSALAFLRKREIKRLKLVVVSHFHRDHYGRLVDIIEAGIAVEKVVVNIPGDRRIADRERPWGCDWEDVQKVLSFLREKKIPYFVPKAGERLIEIKRRGFLTTLDVLCLYDGITTPIGETDINDTSILLRFTHGQTRVLFTGDLNLSLGTYLAGSDLDLNAELLKVPHHGTEGVVPNEFFKRVSPQVAFVPSPKELWFSLRSKRVREFFGEHKIPTYVSGIHGDIEVRLTGAGYEVLSEHTFPLTGR